MERSKINQHPSRPKYAKSPERGTIFYGNKGWRINLKRWKDLFDHPSRAMYSLMDVLKAYPSSNLMEIVFDPEWKGRFGTCPDGSPIMYTACIPFTDGSKGYIDLRGHTPKDDGANPELFQAKDNYCKRNKIDLLLLYGYWTKQEMAGAIKQWMYRNKKTPA